VPDWQPGLPAPSAGSPRCPDPADGAPPAPRSVAIANDQPITRSGLELLATTIPGFTVTASVTSAAELDQPGAAYDVVVLDLQSGPDAGPSLKMVARMAEISRPLVISSWDRPPSLLAVIRAGAWGCITRQASHDTVTCGLNVVAAGGFFLCEQLVDRFRLELNRPLRADTHGLAPREVETLQLIAQGLTQGQIATRMGLSHATVNTYAKRIRAKLKVSNKAELTRIAIELGHVGDGQHDHFAA